MMTLTIMAVTARRESMRTKVISISAVAALYLSVYMWCWSNIPLTAAKTPFQLLGGVGVVLLSSLGLWVVSYFTINWLLKKRCNSTGE